MLNRMLGGVKRKYYYKWSKMADKSKMAAFLRKFNMAAILEYLRTVLSLTPPFIRFVIPKPINMPNFMNDIRKLPPQLKKLFLGILTLSNHSNLVLRLATV